MIKSALFSVVPSGPWGLATVSFGPQTKRAKLPLRLRSPVDTLYILGVMLGTPSGPGQAYCAVLVYNMDREVSCVCGVTGGGGGGGGVCQPQFPHTVQN